MKKYNASLVLCAPGLKIPHISFGTPEGKGTDEARPCKVFYIYEILKSPSSPQIIRTLRYHTPDWGTNASIKSLPAVLRQRWTPSKEVHVGNCVVDHLASIFVQDPYPRRYALYSA